jgi:hypothetical protein
MPFPSGLGQLSERKICLLIWMRECFVILSWGVVRTNISGFCKTRDFFVQKEFSSEVLQDYWRDPELGSRYNKSFWFLQNRSFFCLKRIFK